MGMGHPSCCPKHLPIGRCYQKATGWVRGWAMAGVGAGSVHAREGQLPRGLSQALAAPVQLSQQMATSVPLWPLALGGCGTAWPKGAGHPGCASPRGGRQGREQHPAVMAQPSPSPGCGWTHQLPPSCCACRQHLGNSGPRTRARLCWPTLVPGKPFLPKPAHSKAQQRVRGAKGAPLLPVGFGAKKKGDISSTSASYTDAHVGKSWPWSSCASLKMWPPQTEVQTHFLKTNQ